MLRHGYFISPFCGNNILTIIMWWRNTARLHKKLTKKHPTEIVEHAYAACAICDLNACEIHLRTIRTLAGAFYAQQCIFSHCILGYRAFAKNKYQEKLFSGEFTEGIAVVLLGQLTHFSDSLRFSHNRASWNKSSTRAPDHTHPNNYLLSEMQNFQTFLIIISVLFFKNTLQNHDTSISSFALQL